MSYFLWFLIWSFDICDFKIIVFAWKVLHKSTFHGNRFLWIQEWIFNVFVKPWEQQDGHKDARHRIVVDFGLISGLVSVIFGVQNMLKIVFLLALFLGCFFSDFCLVFSMFGTSKSLFSHWRYCKNRLFMKFVFIEFREWFSVFFGCLGSRFSDFLCLENKLENKTFFHEKLNPEFWIWGGRSGGIWTF